MSGERAQDAADARFREFAAQLPDYVFLIDRERRFRWVNRVAPGLTEEQVLGSRVDDYLDPESLTRAVEAIERCFETQLEQTYVVNAYGDGTTEFFYETRVVTANPVDGEPRCFILTRDVTKQMLAERALQAGEARLRSVLESSPDYILAIDAEQKITYVNRTHPSMTPVEVVGAPLSSFVPNDAKSVAQSVMHAAIHAGRSGGWESSSPVVGAGKFSVRVLPFEGSDNARALVIAEDVTAKHQVERELRLMQSRLSRALASGRIGVWEADPDTGIAEISQGMAELIGASSTTIQLRDWFARFHPEDALVGPTTIDSLINGELSSTELEYRLLGNDGTYRRLVDHVSRTDHDDGSSSLAGVIFDVTELRSVEDQRAALARQLEHAQRIESIGLLAGGIAHDFNNLLTVIIAGSKMAQLAVAAGKNPQIDLASVDEAAARAADLTQQLLAFGRRTTLQLGPVDVASVVDEVARLISRIIPETISVELDVASAGTHGGLVIEGDRQQLLQALLNLCVNARDAMGNGGELRLRVERDGLDASIAVSDTGEGIDDGDLGRIFEPFYTTKPVGSGTGLGLAMVEGIVQQHGGTIDVASTKGQGTTFYLRFPLAESSQQPQPSESIPAKLGRILVADDEPTLRRLVEDVLVDAGYEVVLAQDGLDAVEIFEHASGNFDLVMLDAVMPRLDGWAAFERLRRHSPGIKVLFSSGYTAGAVPTEVAGASGRAPRLIAKPYRLDALLRAVRDAIAGDPA